MRRCGITARSAASASASKAWRSVPRSVRLYARDPNDPSGPTRIVAVSKANYAAKPAARVRVESVAVEGVKEPQPRAEIVGASDYADVILANAGASRGEPVKERGGEQVAAERLLYPLLEDGGGEIDAKVAYAAGAAAGIGKATMRRAQQAIGVTGRGTWNLTGALF